MAKEELKKVTLRVFASDYELLKIYYPKNGPNLMMRAILRKHIREMENQRSARVSQTEVIKSNV